MYPLPKWDNFGTVTFQKFTFLLFCIIFTHHFYKLAVEVEETNPLASTVLLFCSLNNYIIFL
jgi:hypothetical protein